MAFKVPFKIGKKKTAPADDWSDSALEADTGSTPDTTEPADAFGADIAGDKAPARKNLSPILLAAGAVLLMVAVGLGVYFLFLNQPAEDADVPIAVTQPGAPTPGAPETEVVTPAKTPAKKPVRVVKAPTKPVEDPSKIAVKPAPNATIKVKPGRAGLIPPGTKTPSVQSQPGKPAAAVPKPNQPRPIDIMRDGVAGQNGKGLPQAAAVPVVHPTPPLTPALKAQLKTLWQQGAAAKHRGNKAAAKRAWQKMLQLRPGHPGIQEAIDKLG
jgi:hypothetical protein